MPALATKPTKATIEKMTRLLDVWPESESLPDAHLRAETNISDIRHQNRLRRRTELHFGVDLPPHNEKLSTFKNKTCPSSLDTEFAKNYTKFVVTSATNNTETDLEQLATYEKFCEEHEAQLIIIPQCYRNVSAMHSTDDYSWDSKIYPYVLNGRLDLGVVVIDGAAPLHATAVNPLSGLESISGGKHKIYGHSQVQWLPVATPKSETTLYMHTTGTISKGSYSESKAGLKADFHHVHSALFIDIKEDFHYPMQLGWKNGSCQYMNQLWDSNGLASSAEPMLTWVSGDSHQSWEDRKLTDLKVAVMEALGVTYHFLHDVLNVEIGSHHNSVRDNVELANSGKIFVEDEVIGALEYCHRVRRPHTFLVASNHHDHLDVYLNDHTDKKDPANAIFVAKLKGHLYGNHADYTALQAYAEHMYQDECNLEFLGRNDPFLIKDIDYSQHGDKGKCGTRGSPKYFANRKYKTSSGHAHSASIVGGSYISGYSFDQMLANYAKGDSTWSQADIMGFPSGERALLLYGPDSGERNPHIQRVLNV